MQVAVFILFIAAASCRVGNANPHRRAEETGLLFLADYVALFSNSVNFYLVDVKCGLLNAPANGHVEKVAAFGRMAHYFCDKNYKLIGNETRVCSPEGVWSGEEPFCLYSKKSKQLRTKYMQIC